MKNPIDTLLHEAMDIAMECEIFCGEQDHPCEESIQDEWKNEIRAKAIRVQANLRKLIDSQQSA